MATKLANPKASRRKISWQQYQKDVERLADKLGFNEFRTRVCYTGVYGIPRGGSVVAVSLSHLLGIPLLSKPESGCIVCDDLVDEGVTMEKVVGVRPYTCATLYRKDRTRYEPDFVVRTINAFIVFPWETDESAQCDRLK